MNEETIVQLNKTLYGHLNGFTHTYQKAIISKFGQFTEAQLKAAEEDPCNEHIMMIEEWLKSPEGASEVRSHALHSLLNIAMTIKDYFDFEEPELDIEALENALYSNNSIHTVKNLLNKKDM